MFSLLNYDNVEFSGKLSGMKTLFTNFACPEGYQPSKFFESRFRRGMAARTMDVIYDVLRLYKGTYAGCTAFVAETLEGYIAEIQDGNYVTCLMLNKKKDGTLYIKAGIIDDNDVVKTFNLDASSKRLVLLGLMPLLLSEDEAHQIYDTMSDFLEWDVDAEDWLFNNHVEEFSMYLNRFSTNIEMRLSNPNDSDGISVDTNKVSRLKITDLEVDIVEVYCGTPHKYKFVSHESQVSVPVTSNAANMDFEGSYAYNPDREFTEEESSLKAHLLPSYVMPDFVPEICNYFKQSTVFPSPMRVAYLIGPAGTGKTEAANAIFSGLGLPGDHYTCNPSTEIFDFIGQVFPNCGSDDISFDSIRKELNLPSTEDVVNDPATAYEKVYGSKPSGIVDEGKIIVEMIEKIMKYMSSSGNGKNFTYVESGLIRAARLGYGFEIQEIGCVLRPGVAVGLNALLETGSNSFITLPTGETIRKHPDCTFVFTSNDEYEGCCNLNQSVLDRMSLVYRIENPPKEVMKERIMARLNFPDTQILDRMVDVIYDLSKAAKEKEITDGVCGYRALENWAMACMIKAQATGCITDAICYQTAITTVMNKVSQKKEYVDELMSSLTYQFAAPNNV